MSGSERDPVKVQDAECLDRRLANLVYTTDNCPQDPDNSLPLRGWVELGNHWLTLPSGREVQIAFRETFLEIMASNGCDFKTNARLTRRAEKAAGSSGATGAVEAELSVDPKGPVGDVLGVGGRVKVGGAMAPTASTPRAYVVRVVAGGFQIGDRVTGNTDDPGGLLLGRFLLGDWGQIIPKRDARQYGVTVKLLVPAGGLKVVPRERVMADRVPGSEGRLHGNAFDTLKQSVAAWAVETELHSGRHPEGFDGRRRELVLAHGSVYVDLTALAAPAITAEPTKLLPNERAGS